MTSRLLVIPPWGFSPRILEALPGGRAFLLQMRRSFALDLMAWPFTRGTASETPAWQRTLETTAAAMNPICHVIALGGVGTAALIAAAAQPELVKSMVIEGLILPAATLRALGLDRLADAKSATTVMQRGWGSEVMRMAMPGGDDEEVAKLGAMLESELDWAGLLASSNTYDTVNLLEAKPLLPMPTLFLEGQLPIPGYGAVREFLQEIAPQTVFGDLELWPARSDLPESGLEMAARVSEFILSIDP